jgi:hypothetical protein
MNDPLFCCVCFQSPACFIRQCMCCYCEKCSASMKPVCPCGGSGGFCPLTDEIQRYLATPLHSFVPIFELSLTELRQRVDDAFRTALGLVIQQYCLQDALLSKRILCMLRRIAKVEAELRALPSRQAPKSNAEKREWTLTPTNELKLGFDLSPFMGFN